ncbi:hypothetical protein, partial [Mesorhizobium sp. M0185]|uniref:hypothetical protein n=1 Tax=unclassified Mesorhizobium TaxID=325217 RepID=UPI00333C8B19
MARSAKMVEGCWTEHVDAKLEHPSSDRASLGHLLPQGCLDRRHREQVCEDIANSFPPYLLLALRS